ncbi:DUF4348 domain-containing protein [Hoylesella shahii]|jgi:hypothetical protein|uniref:DUF4348 domain-containing protein n=1 Tax=Hoylesella shahii TaxID=228603 RepID=UPI00288BC2C1|nr:DUF4348 domain-containing protein [Hoylesella shahii]
MKKLVFFAIMAVVLVAIGSTTTSCKDKKSVADSIRIDSLQVDSTTRDTLESIIEEQPMPKAADELFDDFVFNFAANRKLQLTRIKFPLDVYQNDKVVKRIEKKDWRMEHFFMKQGYYTLIFDNVKQMDLVKDTTIDHVVIEKITFKNKSVKQYLFNRINGQWTLTSMGLKHISETTNASFLQFYQRFASDSAFQVQSLNDLVEFTAPDPDDDFSSITGSITPEQWPSFKPWLIPDGEIYNIIYGQKYTESNRKLFVIRGVANGMETEMNFKVVKGKWKLMKFNS